MKIWGKILLSSFFCWFPLNEADQNGGIEWSKMGGNGAWLDDEQPLEAVKEMGGIFNS